MREGRIKCVYYYYYYYDQPVLYLWFTVVRCGVIIPAGLVDVSLSSVEWQ